MSTAVASIAKTAMDGVAAKVDGVIQAATLTRESEGTYDPDTGTYTPSTEEDTGRAVFASTDAAADIFPEYVIGPSDELIYLEGFTALAPKETDAVTAGGRTLTIMRSRDLLNTGEFYAVIAQ